jgi:hypothetical protein
MGTWALHRDRYYTARDAVENAPEYEGLGGLSKHSLVSAALVQIDIAERAIASVADEIVALHEEDE